VSVKELFPLNGVLLVQPIEFPTVKTAEDLNNPQLQRFLWEKRDELMNEYIEVTMDIPDEILK
jgi:hypothetical protein